MEDYTLYKPYFRALIFLAFFASLQLITYRCKTVNNAVILTLIAVAIYQIVLSYLGLIIIKY
jgi:hypothetical protein